MSELPNVFYKKDSTEDELKRIVDHLQTRLLEQSQVIAELGKSVKALQEERRRLQCELAEPRMDKAVVDEAYEMRKTLVAFKNLWHGI